MYMTGFLLCLRLCRLLRIRIAADQSLFGAGLTVLVFLPAAVSAAGLAQRLVVQCPYRAACHQNRQAAQKSRQLPAAGVVCPEFSDIIFHSVHLVINMKIKN